MDDDARRRQLQALWVHVTTFVKKTITTPNPTLFIAMDAAHAVALDGNVLILGIDPTQYHLATNLEQLGIKSTIETALSQAARTELHFRIIQGESAADWEEIKQREQIALEMAAKASTRPAAGDRPETGQAPSGASWDEVLSYVHRYFTSLRIKTIPQVRAQYVLDMLPYVAQTEARINPTGQGSADDRGLAHVLEKIGQLAEIDSGVVALQYLQYRRSISPTAASAVPASPAAEAGAALSEANFTPAELSSPGEPTLEDQSSS